MLQIRCLFCDRGNPVDARFCNDCGNLLHLKPCEHCEAVGDRNATHCARCGKAFSPGPAVGIGIGGWSRTRSGLAAMLGTVPVHDAMPEPVFGTSVRETVEPVAQPTESAPQSAAGGSASPPPDEDAASRSAWRRPAALAASLLGVALIGAYAVWHRPGRLEAQPAATSTAAVGTPAAVIAGDTSISSDVAGNESPVGQQDVRRAVEADPGGATGEQARPCSEAVAALRLCQ